MLPPRKLAFVVAASDHGTMIVNRYDYRMVDQARGFGVGFEILERAAHDPNEIETALQLLALRRQYYGDGVVAVDCGANIGTHTIEWARNLSGWGQVIGIEAQERIFYALAGNIAVNNCFNAKALLAAVSDKAGVMRIPVPDYLNPGSFGSLELRRSEHTEFIGQPIDYAEEKGAPVQCITLDSLQLQRIDLLKIDVEGMELEVIAGATDSLARCAPVLMVEQVKTDKDKLREALQTRSYKLFELGINLLAVHGSDKILPHIKTA